MIQPFLATGLGVIATTIGFRGTRVLPGDEEQLDVAATLKRLLRIAGPMAILFGLLWVLGAAGVRLSRPDPILVRHTIAFPEFGVQVAIPETWSVGASEGAKFIARDSATGAVLSGEVAVTDAAKPLTADVDRIVEEQRARFGLERKSSRGVMALGLFNAQWAELSYDAPGNPMRIKTITLRRRNRLLALTCTGGDQAQTACTAALRPDH